MKRILFPSICIAFFACSTSQKTAVSQAGKGNITSNGKLFASLFQQRAPEYYALCAQAYNTARFRLDAALPANTGKPGAIVTDIDETVLDNSPYAVHQSLQGKDYDPATWNEWSNMAQADTVPGAVSFLQYAASKNVEVFYITNREENERAATLKNLRQYNFPNADDAHLLLKQTTSAKEARRQQVLANHNILLLMGDNLSDFSELFDKQTADKRQQTAQQLYSQFGNRFIVLPNPGYGDWETSLYQYNYKLTNAQKDSVIRAVLKKY